ncbi:MAG: DUF4249 family protein, partial [bacterium]
DYFSGEDLPACTGALVQIDDGDSTVVLLESEFQPGVYETPANFHGIPGKIYSLSVQNVDIDDDGILDTVHASSFLPQVPIPDSIKVVQNKQFDGWDIKFYAWEPSATRDYYMFRAYINGKLVTDTITELSIQDDLLINGNYTFGIPVYFLNSKKNDEILHHGDTVTLELASITQEYFDFLVEVQTVDFGSNPLFSGPPANISSNISGDSFGFFTAYSVVKCNTIFLP